MEREYTVIANTREDLPALEAEITASSGAGPIPNRKVDIANPRPGSKIQTHFMLTDEEAEALRSDPRVRAVEIPPNQRDDISIGLHAYQYGDFYRASGDPVVDQSYFNWGLKRSMYETNVYTNTTQSGTDPGVYEYAVDGTGVDIVIQDSGIDPLHPDWFDSGTTSRLQQVDWYAVSGLAGTQDANFYGDYDGHGTHCASIAAGKLYGHAKGAHIYSMKLAGLEGGADPGVGISDPDAFDCIRLWHNKKNDPQDAAYTGRPTVVNMSWGYGATITVDPTSGTYRGTPWTWGVDYTDRGALHAATGVSENFFINGDTLFFRIPVRVASIDAEVEDMIADGIHICIAAGNNLHKADVSGGADYDNSVIFNGSTYNYHRGSSPYSDNAFMVGNINSYWIGYSAITYPAGTDELDNTATTSTRGPGVNIWAPGTAIVAATSRVTSYTTVEYPVDVSSVPGLGGLFFRITSISGTSMASPQVAGVVACHLQVKPDLTPAQMKDRIINDSKAVIYDTGADNDYDRILDSIMGSPNRMLFNRYGKQAFTTNMPGALNGLTIG